MSRLDAEGAGAGAAETLDLSELTRGVVASRGLGDPPLSLRAPHTPLPVRGVSERFARAIENVLENAASFAGARGEIQVELRRLGEDAVLRVLDSGPGIPEAHLTRVFSRFFSYRPTDDVPSHSGLGLAIASRIVETAGGAIRASNRPSGGACFEIRLPLCTA